MAVRRFLVAGRYRLLEPVGTGGMGRVWLARDEMLDRDVAVKEFVPPEWMTDAEKNRLRDRTLREARSAARLNHPHVVRIYDVVHAENLPWIVMEYIPSRSLHQAVKEDGPYSAAATARIGLDVLSALTAAHAAGVLHRDVKPHNVLIGPDGRVVLTDFGLATFVDDGSVTGPGMVVGSPQYVSPERARDGASTVESDLWSLGATLYAAVEGRSPYARESAMATLMALATEQPDPPTKAGLLTPVLTGLLRREPADRLTAVEVEERLRAIVATELSRGPVAAPRTIVPGPRRPTEDVPSRPGRSAVATAMATPAVRSPERPVDRSRPESVTSVLSGAVPAVGVEREARRMRPTPALIALVVVLLLAAGLLVTSWMIWQREPGRRQAAPTALTSSSAVATTTAGAPAGFTSVACTRPPGPNLPRTPQPGAARQAKGFDLLPSWSEYVDPTGFQVAVPDGWSYERIGTTVCFRDPSNIRFLAVDPARNPSADPVRACNTEAARLIRGGELPRYQRISLDRTSLQITAADWEYTWTPAEGVRMHAKTRWFKSGDHAYALSWATRDLDWQINTPYFGATISSFIPIA